MIVNLQMFCINRNTLADKRLDIASVGQKMIRKFYSLEVNHEKEFNK